MELDLNSLKRNSKIGSVITTIENESEDEDHRDSARRNSLLIKKSKLKEKSKFNLC